MHHLFQADNLVCRDTLMNLRSTLLPLACWREYPAFKSLLTVMESKPIYFRKEKALFFHSEKYNQRRLRNISLHYFECWILKENDKALLQRPAFLSLAGQSTPGLCTRVRHTSRMHAVHLWIRNGNGHTKDLHFYSGQAKALHTLQTQNCSLQHPPDFFVQFLVCQ